MDECMDCGAEYEPRRGQYYRRCPDCAAEYRRWYHRTYNTGGLDRRIPVEVIGSVPGLDPEEQWYLSGFFHSLFSASDFMVSVHDGSFDGLRVRQGEQEYWVNRRRLEAVNGDGTPAPSRIEQQVEAQ